MTVASNMSEQLEVHNALLVAINGAVSLFNDLFKSIAPIDATCYPTSAEELQGNRNGSTSGSSSSSSSSSSTTCAKCSVDSANAAAAAASRRISLSPVISSSNSDTEDSNARTGEIDPDESVTFQRFAGSQCLQIQHLSGHLRNIRSSVRRLHILDNRVVRDNQNDAEEISEILKFQENNSFLKSKLIESKNQNALISMQLSAVKNYLVNEVNRSEKSDEMLNTKENMLVEMTAERDDYKKKFMDGITAQNSRNLHLETSNNIRNQVQDPRRNLVGLHIRKEFGQGSFYFGLVVMFLSPYYKVRSRSTVLSCPVLSCLVLSCLVLFYVALAFPIIF